MFRFANGYFKGGLDGTGDLAKRLALIPDEDMHDWDRPLIDPSETTESIGALSPLGSVEDLEPLNPMGSLEDHEELVQDEVDIVADADAPPPVKKRRRDVIRSRLGLGKRNKLETSRSK
jgi:hypothetical protein